MGFEPTTTGITILDSTIELHLPLIGDIFSVVRKSIKNRVNSPSRFRRQRMRNIKRVRIILKLERDIGLEPMTKDWKSLVLPLN